MAKTRRRSNKSKKCRKSRKNKLYGGVAPTDSNTLSDSIKNDIKKDLEIVKAVVNHVSISDEPTTTIDVSRFSPWFRYSCKSNIHCELIKAYMYAMLVRYHKNQRDRSNFYNKYITHLEKSNIIDGQNTVLTTTKLEGFNNNFTSIEGKLYKRINNQKIYGDLIMELINGCRERLQNVNNWN